MAENDGSKTWRVYTGDGLYLPGVPARTLTKAEYEKLSERMRVSVDQSGLYRRAKGSAPNAEPPEPADDSGATEPTGEGS